MRVPKLKEINAERLIDMAMQDPAVCPLVALLSHAVLLLLQGVADLPVERPGCGLLVTYRGGEIRSRGTMGTYV